jgi:hypothetical protein
VAHAEEQSAHEKADPEARGGEQEGFDHAGRLRASSGPRVVIRGATSGPGVLVTRDSLPEELE